MYYFFIMPLIMPDILFVSVKPNAVRMLDTSCVTGVRRAVMFELDMLEPAPLSEDPLLPPEEQLQLQFPHVTVVGPDPQVLPVAVLPEHTTVTLVPVPLVPLPGTTITVVELVVVVLVVVVEPGPVVITVVLVTVVLVVVVLVVTTGGVETPQAAGAGRDAVICNAVCKQTKRLHFQPLSFIHTHILSKAQLGDIPAHFPLQTRLCKRSLYNNGFLLVTGLLTVARTSAILDGYSPTPEDNAQAKVTDYLKNL